jgi:putative transposase
MTTASAMQLVEQHIIKSNDPRWAVIDHASWMSKNIYNAANYMIRQSYILDNKYLNYYYIEKHFKKNNLLADQQLPLKVVQQVLKQVDHGWHSYFAAMAEYKKTPGKFLGRPKLPSYKHVADGRNVLVYTRQAVNMRQFKKRGVIIPSGLDIEIETQQTTFDQVRIVPRKDHYVIEVVYTRTVDPADVHPGRMASIDLGVNNLATIAFNQPGMSPLLVNGRPLKSINQRYNKHKAWLQSQLTGERKTSHQIVSITNKRNRRVQGYLHTASRKIIDALVKRGIGTLIIGKNDGWKQEVNLGKRTNQNFVQIPHARFIEMLTYKAQLVGITVLTSKESYTSKCSFLDNEPVQKHEHYAGKRVKRGLFCAGNGRLINADVNGAYNILRKAIPNALGDGIGAAVVQPVHLPLSVGLSA